MIQPTDRATTTIAPGSRRRRWLVPMGVAAAVLVGVALWLTQPWLLFVDTVADEQLPLPLGATADPDVGPDPSPPTSDAPVEPDAPLAGTTPGAGDPPGSDETTVPDATASTDATANGAGTANGDARPGPATEPGAGETPTPSGPVVLAQGDFVSRDHATSGRVAVVQLEDGRRVLTIEDLDTDNGPDLFVYLDDDAADAPSDEFDDGTSLGRLRANQGDLVYELPSDVDLATIGSVGIWCDRFSSLFGAADLVPVAV